MALVPQAKKLHSVQVPWLTYVADLEDAIDRFELLLQWKPVNKNPLSKNDFLWTSRSFFNLTLLHVSDEDG